MAIRTELTVRLQNTPGSLARFCELLGQEHVNILALALDGGVTLRVVVDNPLHAASVLLGKHYQVSERAVLFATVPNEPGALTRVARLISDAGVNIEYLYASAAEGTAMSTVVAGVPDAQRAAAAAGL
jgi:hypothetical protein